MKSRQYCPAVGFGRPVLPDCRSWTSFPSRNHLPAGNSRLYIFGRSLEIVDCLGIDLVERRIVFPLGNIIVAKLGDSDLLNSLAVVRCDGEVNRSCGTHSGIDELTGREISDFVDEVLYAAGVHLFRTTRPPVLAAAGQEISFGPVVNLDFVEILGAEVEQLLVAEIVQTLV